MRDGGRNSSARVPFFGRRQSPRRPGRSSALGSGVVGRVALTALGGAGVAAYATETTRPRPVVLVHGILDSAKNMELAGNWVRQALGLGAYVRCVEVGNGEIDSITRSMEWQLRQLAAVLQADERLREGFNMIGYSQGSLLARAFVQRFGRPRVHTLISWAGPQAGQYGCPDWEVNWPDAAAGTVKTLTQITSSMWYTPAIQEVVSFSNYWRDPHRLELYRARSTFLADVNNEGRGPPNRTYADRMRALEAFVLVASTADTIIIPRESSWFAFYAPNSTSEVLPLRQSELYTKDLIGLRTLDRTGRLHFASCHCRHREVPTDLCRLQVWDRASRRFLEPQGALPSLLRWLRPQAQPRSRTRRADRDGV